jgi:hypothetical protein
MITTWIDQTLFRNLGITEIVWVMFGILAITLLWSTMARIGKSFSPSHLFTVLMAAITLLSLGLLMKEVKKWQVQILNSNLQHLGTAAIIWAFIAAIAACIMLYATILQYNVVLMIGAATVLLGTATTLFDATSLSMAVDAPTQSGLLDLIAFSRVLTMSGVAAFVVAMIRAVVHTIQRDRRSMPNQNAS